MGFSVGSLHSGWRLFTPSLPLLGTNLDLRGSTRYSDGKMPDGRRIGDVLATRTDVVNARAKVARFFARGLDRRPVKVLPNFRPTSYPPAPEVGLPQFKLFSPVDWIFVLEVPPSGALTPAAAASAVW
jgi:hypothetical protein